MPRSAGEPAVKITGVLDTAALFDGMLGQLGALGGGPMPDLSGMLGDTRAVDLPLAGEPPAAPDAPRPGACRSKVRTVAMKLDYAITNVNEPVEIPDPKG